jgi:heptosyltransferase-2
VRERAVQVEQIKRVVVRGTNWVGDACMTVPALRELRRILPQAHITLATRPWAVGLFSDADFIDDIMIYDRKERRALRAMMRQVKAWRARRFDLAVLFQNAFEAALIARLARVPVRLGYNKDGRHALLTHPLALPAWHGTRHETFYYLNIVAELERLIYGASDLLDHEPQFKLTVSEARQSEARSFLKARGVSLTRPVVALCPGSTNSRAKRWPVERYAALADQLAEELGAEVLLVGSPDEVPVSQEVAALMRHKSVMLTGQTDLTQLVALLGQVDLLVTNDTGPAHIAAALERPTLVIFGPTDPATTRPFASVAEIIYHPPDCAPCMLRDCPIDHRCMTAITPAEVFARSVVILKDKGAEVRA